MAIPDYVPTTWVDDSVPAINALNLNKIEQGIDVATDAINELEQQIPEDPTVVGEITMFGGATSPSGWFECNGVALNRVTYSALFTIIGTRYGNGDGSSTFNIPDMRGYFPRGWDHGRGTDNNRVLGSSQSDELKEHLHQTVADQQDTGVVAVSSTVPFIRKHGTGSNSNYNLHSAIDGVKATISPTSETGGSETRPKNVAVMFIIKA